MKTIKTISIFFYSLVIILSGCKKDDLIPILADAGEDQVVKPTTEVLLDGTKSSGPDGFNYSWSYTGLVPEADINFQDKTTATPSFIPPEGGLYAFTLTVSHGGLTSEDVILVEATGALTIGGTLTGNTILKNNENDPDLPDYIIESDLIVPSGITLTIESHVRLEVAENKGIIVRGTLTDANQDDYYTDISLTSASGWKGILVDGGTLNLGGLNITKAGFSTFEGQNEAASVIFDGSSPALSGFLSNVFVGSYSYDMLVETEVLGFNTLGKNKFSAEIPVKAPLDFIRLFSGKNTYPAGYKYMHLIPEPVETGNQLPDEDYYFFYEGKYYIDGSFRAKSKVYSDGNSTFYIKENSSMIFEDYTSLGSNYEGQTIITGLNNAKWNGIAANENATLKLNNVLLTNAGAAPVVGGSINSPVKTEF